MLADFEDIAEDLGIDLPDDLGQLIELVARPSKPGQIAPLSSIPDIEFIDAGDAERILGDWLGRKKQRGADYILLPFAQTGAGDALCYVEFEEGGRGIALVIHDEETSTLEFPSVSHWITDRYVKACLNLQDLDCDPAEGVVRMKGEVSLLSSIILPEHRELLEGLLNADIVERAIGTRIVQSLLSQELADSLGQSLVSDLEIEFDVRPEWED